MRMWMSFGLLAALAQLQPQPQTVAYPDLVCMVLKDLGQFTPDNQKSLRYLSLAAVPLDRREDVYRVLCGHCQHLSRSSDLPRPALVPGSAGALVRLSLEDYGWTHEIWDKLVSPYEHVTLETDEYKPWEEGHYDHQGKWVRERVGVTKVKTRKDNALAPWLSEGAAGKENVAALVAMTGSRAPLVDGRWWFNQTAIQFQRGVGYYDFLGIKNEKDFHALVGYEKKNDKTFVELRDAVAESGVTIEPRAFARHKVIGGSYWRSLDFKHAADKSNPIRVLGRDIESSYDASEQFGSLPNGWWATGLFDSKGERQDFAPPEIAPRNWRASGNDSRIHVNASCFSCHTDGGLQSIDGWVRNLLQPPISLEVRGTEKATELRQQYARKLETFIAGDRAAFETVVKEVTGWNSERYAREYWAFFESYENARVDLAYVAHDMGVSEEKLKAVLDVNLKNRTLDLVASSLLLEGERKRFLRVKQYEEIVPLIRGYLAGTK